MLKAVPCLKVAPRAFAGLFIGASLLLTLQPLAREAYQSTYVPRAAPSTLITDATIFDGRGHKLANQDLLIRDGKIAAIGPGLSAEGAILIPAQGRFITPGIIDVHSHLGDYPSPAIASTRDGNEAIAPNTAQVWAEHSVYTQDPQFHLALAGGITTLQILPGSANLFGGRGVTLKNIPARSVQEMKFPGAPQSLKMACGENPKRVYGGRMLTPSTRMGNVAGYRDAWAKARHYMNQIAIHEKDAEKSLPDPNLQLDTLAAVLRGEILIHNHCYRAEEMAVMMDIAKEFDYKITAFHHAVEAYKYADKLAEAGICSAMWADWWGFKFEAFDGIPQNVALVEQAGACAIVHSDSPLGIQRLNQEAARAAAAARRVGMAVSDATAISWVTYNAAKALGISNLTGSIEVGKAADIVLWSSNPLSVYARADQVYIDGYQYFDRLDTSKQPLSDFDLHQTERGRAR